MHRELHTAISDVFSIPSLLRADCIIPSVSLTFCRLNSRCSFASLSLA